jgi:hypothetical protein
LRVAVARTCLLPRRATHDPADRRSAPHICPDPAGSNLVGPPRGNSKARRDAHRGRDALRVAPRRPAHRDPDAGAPRRLPCRTVLLDCLPPAFRCWGLGVCRASRPGCRSAMHARYRVRAQGSKPVGSKPAVARDHPQLHIGRCRTPFAQSALIARIRQAAPEIGPSHRPPAISRTRRKKYRRFRARTVTYACRGTNRHVEFGYSDAGRALFNRKRPESALSSISFGPRTPGL